jgi:hypothetical protein
VSEHKTSNETGPKTGPRPGAPKNGQDVEKERRALRELIDELRRQPESIDDGGFYRNVGRFIIRPLMRPYLSGDRGH